jgi:hypothetical protein
MSYKPLPSYLTIKPSNIDGLGLFATDDIDENHVLGMTHVYNPNFQDGYIRTPLGGFFNHSETPNCKVIVDGDYLFLKAIRNINAGEEITAYYTLYKLEK